MAIGQRARPIEQEIRRAKADIVWEYVCYMHSLRAGEGKSYRAIAEEVGVSRTTARRYVRDYERYESGRDPGANGNTPIRRHCPVCDEMFTASRADKTYCSNACKQDAYRHRKRGEVFPITSPTADTSRAEQDALAFGGLVPA